MRGKRIKHILNCYAFNLQDTRAAGFQLGECHTKSSQHINTHKYKRHCYNSHFERKRTTPWGQSRSFSDSTWYISPRKGLQVMRLPVFTRTGQGVGVLGHPPGSACSLTGILRQVHINSERFNFLDLDRRLTSIMKSFTKWDLHWLSVTRLGQGITLRQSRSPKVRNRKLSEVFESLAREKAEVHGLIHFYRREMRWDLTELFKYVLGRNNSLHVYWAEAILCILFR